MTPKPPDLSDPSARDARGRRRLVAVLQVVALFVLPTLIAELSWGSTPIEQAGGGLLVNLPIYGGGALLVRELVRRAGRGWIGVLLLGCGYGFVEEGTLHQLNAPVMTPPYSAATQWLGFNVLYTPWVVVLHAVWSIALPILLVELILPARRDRPYLRVPGLVVVAVVYLAGVAILNGLAPYFTPHFTPSAGERVAYLGAAVVLAATGLLLPRRAGRTGPPPPRPAVLAGAACGLGFAISNVSLGTVAYLPVLGEMPAVLLPLASTLLVVVASTVLVARWRSGRGFDDRHRFALAAGALVAHTAFGVLLVARTPLDRMGVAGVGVVMVALLVVLGRRVLARPPADRAPVPRSQPAGS